VNELKLKTLCHFILARGVLYQQFLQRLGLADQEYLTRTLEFSDLFEFLSAYYPNKDLLDVRQDK
jgi:hypothetical protein